jgi:hypothetical protein
MDEAHTRTIYEVNGVGSGIHRRREAQQCLGVGAVLRRLAFPPSILCRL